MQPSMSGRSQLNAGTEVDVLEVVTVTVVELLDVVAPSIVDDDGDMVVDVVVVGGKIGLEQDRLHTRATLFCLLAPRRSGQPVHESSRRLSLRHTSIPMRRAFRQSRTQLRTIVHRPPLFVRHLDSSEILPMHSSNSSFSWATQSR
jgi:hypothetical protein